MGTLTTPVGIINHSDFNKESFSALIYLACSEFESRLTKLINEYKLGDWWVHIIPNCRMKTINNDYKKRDKADIDLGRISCTYFSEKAMIAYKTPALCKALGYGGEIAAREDLLKLKNWRNRADHKAHPPLLLFNKWELDEIQSTLRILDQQIA